MVRHPLAAGQLLDDRYRIEALLGQGGMGAVYRAHDLTRDQPAAIKVLLELDLDLLDRFEREAQITAKVDPTGGVVRVLGVGRDVVPYIAMELIAGDDLGTHLERGFAPRDLAGLLGQVARTLAKCHAVGVLHRDLKPANVLIDPSGAPRLVDFGIARDHALERLTRTGDFLGTPGYMAPEQADDAKAVGAPADIYAVGAILYRGLAGRAPFEGDLQQVLHDLLLTDPTPPSRVAPGVPPDLEAVCLKAIAHDPRDRYASAGALADDLERAAAGEPVAARPLGRVARFRRRYARGAPGARLVVHAALGALGLALVAGLFAARLLGNQALDAHEAWEQGALVPLRYGATGATPSFTREDLAARRTTLGRARWVVSSEAATRVDRALSRLAAHTVLLRHLAGEAVSLPDGADAPSLIVTAKILIDRGERDRGARRLLRLAPNVPPLEGQVRWILRLQVSNLSRSPAERLDRLRAEAAELGDDPELRELARSLITRAIADTYAAVVRRAVTFEGTPQTLAALAAAPELDERGRAALAASKAAALEASAPVWSERIRKIRQPETELLPLLRRLSEFVQAEPQALPGPALRRVAQQAQAVSLEAYDAVSSNPLARKETEVRARLVIDVSQHLYYAFDPERRDPVSLLDPIRLILHGQRAVQAGVPLELPLAMFRIAKGEQTLLASPRQLLANVLPAQGRTQTRLLKDLLPKLEKLFEQRPRSRAIAYAIAVILIDLNVYKHGLFRGDLPDRLASTDRAVRLARQACGEPPGQLDDLARIYTARASYERAKLCARRHALEAERPKTKRDPRPQRWLEELIAACQTARRLNVDIEYLFGTFEDESNATETLYGLAPALRLWESANGYYAAMQRRGDSLTFQLLAARAAVYRNLALKLEASERSDDALAAARQAVLMAVRANESKTDPERYNARAILARLLIDRGALDEAEATLAPDLPAGLINWRLAAQYVRIAIERSDAAEGERRWDLLKTRTKVLQRLHGWRKRLDRLGDQ